MKCAWCGSGASIPHEDPWQRCLACGTLINTDPQMGVDVYGPNSGYYTHDEALAWGPLRRELERVRAELAAVGFWPWRKPPHLDALLRAGFRLDGTETVLDYGCGSGMYAELTELYGARLVDRFDLFNPECNDPLVLAFDHDWVLLRHILEHVKEPIDVLLNLRHSNRQFLVWLPIAWSTQHVREGMAWQMLCPEHVFVPSMLGALTLFKAAGLTLVSTWLDTNRTTFKDGSSVCFHLKRSYE